MNHTFAIPVYGNAPNLYPLIQSLRSQTKPSADILLATSTPTEAVEAFAKQQELPLHVNPRCAGIASDWNFAMAAAKSQLVTLAHQDDLFAPAYVDTLTAALHSHPDAVLAFCDYTEHTPLGVRHNNLNLRIKRALCRRAFGAQDCLRSRRDKLRLLSLGNPICCPSVMLNLDNLSGFRFPEGFKTNLDWMAWLLLAEQPGGFVYLRTRLVSKGIHPHSETTVTIANRAREKEDRRIFEHLWPKPMAVVLSSIYRLSYLANRLGVRSA